MGETVNRSNQRHGKIQLIRHIRLSGLADAPRLDRVDQSLHRGEEANIVNTHHKRKPVSDLRPPRRLVSTRRQPTATAADRLHPLRHMDRDRQAPHPTHPVFGARPDTIQPQNGPESEGRPAGQARPVTPTDRRQVRLGRAMRQIPATGAMVSATGLGQMHQHRPGKASCSARSPAR